MRWSYSTWRLFSPIFLAVPLLSFAMYELPCDSRLLAESEIVALSQIGVREYGSNRGEVEKYLKSVGLGGGYSYCAAGVYWCFVAATENLKLSSSNIPIKRTAVANAMYNDAKMRGIKISRKVKRNDLLIWKSKSSWRGHIERAITSENRGIVKTIGFNVRTTKGEGVAIKTRFLAHPIGKLMLRGAITFREVNNDN